jgi:hypothetical protein
MKIYIDLDGVLTDFAKALSDLLGEKVDPKEHIHLSDEQWSKVNGAGESFWADMDWYAGGHEVWEAAKRHNPTILSSPSRHDSSRAGKREWVRKNLGDVPVVLEVRKEKYAAPDAVLVDDLRKNIDRWEKAGGKGILHRNAEDTIRKIEEVMGMSKEAFKTVKVKSKTDPSKTIVLEKLRGGRGTEVMKDKTEYDRRKEKNWKEHLAGCLRVVTAYLSKEGSVHPALVEIADDMTSDLDKFRKTVDRLKEMDPEGAERFVAKNRLEAIFGDLDYQIEQVRHGDRGGIGRFDYEMGRLKDLFRRVPGVSSLMDKRAYEDFKFKTHPVVIDPYDAIVQQAHREMGPAGRNIDVIKLEPNCPGKTKAWVTNQDLFGGDEGRKRVVHLCLKKIKDEFNKAHGKGYNITNAEDAKRMRDIVLTYLKDVVLRHEGAHIEQEVKGKGQFGPSPETGAERAEDWSKLQQMGIMKKAGFFPENYDPVKGKFIGKATPIRMDRPMRREVPFSFKRLNTESLNYVKRTLLGLKDPRATKIWNYIEAGYLGDYSSGQEEDLKKIVQQEAADYSFSVGELVNNLLSNKRIQELRSTPISEGLARKLARSVVIRYASQCGEAGTEL